MIAVDEHIVNVWVDILFSSFRSHSSVASRGTGMTGRNLMESGTKAGSPRIPSAFPHQGSMRVQVI